MSAEILNQCKKEASQLGEDSACLLDASLQSKLYQGASQGLQDMGPGLKT